MLPAAVGVVAAVDLAVVAAAVVVAAVVVLQIPLKITPKGQSITDATTETTGDTMATVAAAVVVGTTTVVEFVVAALVVLTVVLAAFVVTTAAAVEVVAGAGAHSPKRPTTPKRQSLFSRAAPDRSMAAALAVAKRARTGKREYIVYEIGRVGRLT